MSLRHTREVTAADDPSAVAAGKLCPSHYGSTSTNYATNPTHHFTEGTLGALLYRDTLAVDGKSWLTPGAAGTLLAGTGGAPAFTATPTLTSLTFGNYVLSGGPFVTLSGHRWLHSEGGGGSGSVFENTGFGYDALATIAGNGYANSAFGKNALRLLNGTAPNASSNAAGGYGSLEFLTTGSFNTAWGTATLAALTTQSSSAAFGYHAGSNAIPSGGSNCYFGPFAGRGAAGSATGIGNSAFGDSCLQAYTTADLSAAFGSGSLENVTSGDNNTGFGALTLRAVTTSTGCIGLGFSAGRYETGSNKFFVNNTNRSTETGDRTLSILYGVMGATAADQTLTVNGFLVVTQGLTLPGGTLLTTSAALTNGAAAQTGTLTNAPAAGNPTKWIPINDNGTVRYIPAW